LLKVPPLVAKLLVQRGYSDKETAQVFLHGGLERLHDPFLMKGMKEAVARIELAKAQGEKIRIYGDYDADGVSSTTLMTCLFRKLELDFDHYIPHRRLEGYGLNNAAIDLAAAAGVKLLVTVDTGISAVDQIAYASTLGIDVVVTDHHEPPAVLPDAYALVNPKLSDCPYPFKGLAGVGVAFKLAQALLGEPPIEWTDIVALGTIADLMPLTDENRVLVRSGIERLRHSEKPGFRALAEVAGIDLPTITATNIAFGMAPRINAAGRLEHADSAVRLLAAEDEETAGASAISLDTLNRERQRVVEAIVKEASALWLEKCEAAQREGRPEPAVIVLAAEGWNAGVVGIVASKFIERHYKPTLILGIDAENGMSKGSARSIDGFDLHAALTACDDLLDHYGGHQAAAGMSLHRDQLEQFEQRLGELARQWLKPEDWIPKTSVDLACSIEDASLKVLEQLSLLEPFGAGNTAPRLMLSGAVLADHRAIGKEKSHLKLSLSAEGSLLDAIGFGWGHAASRLTTGAAIELVGELSLNEWNGQQKAQFMVHDLRVHDTQLIDWRAEGSPLAAARKLLADEASAGAMWVIPSEAWRHAILAETEAASRGIQLYTYEELELNLTVIEASVMVLLGRPPAMDRLGALLKRAIRLERVYACYNQAELPSEGQSGRNVASRKGAAAIDAEGLPDRSVFGQLYQTLRRVAPLPETGCKTRLSTMMGWPEKLVDFMLQVFLELELLIVEEGELKLPSSPQKKDLSHSAVYRNRQRAVEAERVLFAEAAELAKWITEQSKEALKVVGAASANINIGSSDIKEGVAVS